VPCFSKGSVTLSSTGPVKLCTGNCYAPTRMGRHVSATPTDSSDSRGDLTMIHTVEAREKPGTVVMVQNGQKPSPSSAHELLFRNLKNYYFR
jgi:hypothetical protein